MKIFKLCGIKDQDGLEHHIYLPMEQAVLNKKLTIRDKKEKQELKIQIFGVCEVKIPDFMLPNLI